MSVGLKFRRITTFTPSKATTDGAGVAIKRVALMGVPTVDPLLMVDELRSPYREDFSAGFPSHPHRGMQTLTYMLSGGIIHEDSMGNRGEIRDGGVQWMSAGSGVIHSEMPTQDTEGLHGFQLWFNLPAALKMSAPRYRDIAASDLPVYSSGVATMTTIAGEWRSEGESLATGPLKELAPIARMADLEVNAHATIRLDVAPSENTSIFVFEGALDVEVQTLQSPGLAVFEGGDTLQITAAAMGARCLVLTGVPIAEPVVNYGPFVMNTREEIETALREYQDGTFLQV